MIILGTAPILHRYQMVLYSGWTASLAPTACHYLFLTISKLSKYIFFSSWKNLCLEFSVTKFDKVHIDIIFVNLSFFCLYLPQNQIFPILSMHIRKTYIHYFIFHNFSTIRRVEPYPSSSHYDRYFFLISQGKFSIQRNSDPIWSTLCCPCL